MRGLKTLIIGMGILIVTGFVFLVIGIVDKTDHLSRSGRPFSQVSVNIPEGTNLVEMRVDDGKIVVRLKLSDGSHRIVVLNAETGKPTRQIDLKSNR